METLYGYLLHYNHIKDEWNAFLRENMSKYFNGQLKSGEIFCSKDVKSLIKTIQDLEKKNEK